jgi:hypothetical protein
MIWHVEGMKLGIILRPDGIHLMQDQGEERMSSPDGQCCEYEVSPHPPLHSRSPDLEEPSSKKGCIGLREVLAGIEGVRADLLE